MASGPAEKDYHAKEKKKGLAKRIFSRPNKKTQRDDNGERANTPEYGSAPSSKQKTYRRDIPNVAGHKMHSTSVPQDLISSQTEQLDGYYSKSDNKFNSIPSVVLRSASNDANISKDLERPSSGGNGNESFSPIQPPNQSSSSSALDQSLSPNNNRSNVALLAPTNSLERRSGRFRRERKPTGTFWRSGSMRSLKKWVATIGGSRENLDAFNNNMDNGTFRSYPTGIQSNNNSPYDQLRDSSADADSHSIHSVNGCSVDSGRGTPDMHSREPSLNTGVDSNSVHSVTIDNIIPPPPYPSSKMQIERVPATSGIVNHGNTCYINAVIQCLANTDPLAEFLVAGKFNEYLGTSVRQMNNARRFGSDGEITKALAKFLLALWTNRYKPDISKRWHRLVGIYGSQFANNMQQDTQELLTWLLDKVHEDLNQANCSRKYRQIRKLNSQSGEQNMAEEAMTNHRKNHDSYISNLFEAQFRSAITCPMCGKTSLNYDPFMCVPLPVPQSSTKPIFVVMAFVNRLPRQLCLGLNADATASMIEIKACLAKVASLRVEQLILVQLDLSGWGVSLKDKDEVCSLKSGSTVHAIETPTQYDDSEELIILVCNVVNNSNYTRYGGPFALKVHRQLTYGDLCRSLLVTVKPQLKSSVQIQDIPLDAFCIEISNEYSVGSVLPTQVNMPLYTEEVDRTLRISASKSGPVHLKVCLQWNPETANKYVSDTPEIIRQHTSADDLRNEMSQPAKSDLYHCLQEYTKPELLDQWFCGKCRRSQTNAPKTMLFWSLPDILILHLKRFKLFADGSQVKLDPVVNFPIKGLDLTKFVYNGNGTPCNTRKDRARMSRDGSLYIDTMQDNVYDLFSVCNHLGDSMNSGHYTAFCRNPVDGLWRKFDDQDVSLVQDTSTLLSKSSYLLFYERRGSNLYRNCTNSVESGFCDHWYSKYFPPPPPVALSNPGYYPINVVGPKDGDKSIARVLDNAGQIVLAPSGFGKTEKPPLPPPRSSSMEALNSCKPPIGKKPVPAPRRPSIGQMSQGSGSDNTPSSSNNESMPIQPINGVIGNVQKKGRNKVGDRMKSIDDEFSLERSYSTRIKTNSQVETDL